jgi:RNA polymerase sigma-70 factor, ECF subfamily
MEKECAGLPSFSGELSAMSVNSLPNLRVKVGFAPTTAQLPPTIQELPIVLLISTGGRAADSLISVMTEPNRAIVEVKRQSATFNVMRSEIEQAVQLLQRGDNAALEQALGLLQNTVFSFSMRVCGQREDAEDTMQEVLLKSVPHLPKFDSPKALVVWLYKVAKNRCLMSRRRSKFAANPDLSLEELMPDRREFEQMGTDGSINPEAFAIRSEEAGRLRAAIQQLPPQYRIVLVLRDMEGLTDEEVAEITGLRSGTVRVRLHRSRLFVRKEIIKGLKPRQGRAGVGPRTSSQEHLGNEQPRPARCKALFAELSNYLDEQLDDSLCKELERHLKGCGACKVFLSSLKATVEQCRRSPTESPDRKKATELRMKVLADYERLVAKNIRS